MSAAAVLAALALAAWVWLLALHGRFWRGDQRLSDATPDQAPAVAVVIPARNEAETIAEAVASHLDQDYAGPVRVIVVDDNSDDGTAEAARAVGDDRVTVVAGAPLAAGWTGKLWAVEQGIRAAAELAPEARYLLLTDADIEHDPDSLRPLVAKAEAGNLDLVSLMARLRCKTRWEQLLIPAFVFFFQKLYPFPRVNDPRRRTAAAAGGCMLVRRRALDDAGGMAAIRDRVIDDCALAALLKARGPIWLGLTDRVHSLRAYPRLSDVWDMVARTAFVQLRHSSLLLAGTVLGMALLYLVPPVVGMGAVLAGDRLAANLGLGAWLLMTVAYGPTLRLYRLSILEGFTLPYAALLYTLMTVDSARRHWRGAGAAWKGRTYPERGG
ncbi:MAG: glycosyltransferase [Hyphomicrobiales bacterium]|nr:glycosyltransferase [Hyphomicrobiales bacterium]